MIMTSTLKANSGKCPFWDIDVSVIGWYREKEGNTWSFLRAECPIIQNSKLPIWEQEQRYKLMSCKDPSQCPLYTEFQPSMTLER